ncbi:MAG: DUF4105 domain-containing protein [Gemmatimonadetes bacterium]|nr:DUF4105 domain-containing protein [Gemmatimonadota bacterium]
MSWWRRLRTTVCAAVALVLPIAAVGAQTPSPPAPSTAATAPEPGSDIEVTLMTFGLGQEVFERFGHNALWIHDPSSGTDVAYNWGLFSFRQPHFLQRFLTGDTKYWMGGEDANLMIAQYQALGRPITLQRLNLTPAQKLALRDFLHWNEREENRFYRYDYYRDNCSTRLRDALDHALGGALRAATDTIVTPFTYRRESVRLTDGDRPIQTGIDIALGRPADAPLTLWESFFIPMRMRDAIRDLTLPIGPNGAPVRLVAEERHIAPYPGTTLVPELVTAPRLVWRLLLVGVVLAAVLAGIRIMAVSRRGAAWGFALVASVWSLLCGVIGVVIVLAWTMTRHVFWSWNENLFQVSPLSLALVVLVPLALLRGRATRAARVMATAVLLLSAFGALLAIIPGGQESRAVVALFLPVHLVMAWAIAQPQVKPPASRAG